VIHITDTTVFDESEIQERVVRAAIEQLVPFRPFAAAVAPPNWAPEFELPFQLLHATNGVALLQTAAADCARPRPVNARTASDKDFMRRDFIVASQVNFGRELQLRPVIGP